MALRKGKGRGEDRIEMPMSSMIDVVFLLLIYFIVTHTEELSEAHLAVNLPSPGGQPTEAEVKLLEITVTPGAVYLNQKMVTQGQLQTHLKHFAGLDPDQTVLVKCDSKARTGELVRVLDIAHGAGLNQINVLSLN